MQDYLELDDDRDVTIFVEHYPEFTISTTWRNNGTVAGYTCFEWDNAN